jgi:hypothetical protein
MIPILAAAMLAAGGNGPVRVAAPPIARAEFHDAMRKLWEDHITWTRLYIVSAAAGLPDADQTAQRLLKNQAEIGDAIVPYYGASAGAGLTALLRNHILVAARLIGAAKSGDTSAVRSASQAWYANADSIADFLSRANPEQWPNATLREGMHMHLDLTLKEATARLHGDWVNDIAAYDDIHRHILQLADVLSNGIIRQFPTRFQ